MKYLTLLLTCTFLLSACSSKNITPPDVSLVDLDFGEVSLFQTTLKVTTNVRNESPDRMHFTGARHNVELNDINLGKAISRERFSLNPLEERRVVSTLEISHLTLMTRIQDLLDSTALDYKLESEFYVGGPFSGDTIRSTNSGTLIQ